MALTVVVFVPGILGTTLITPDEMFGSVWPDKVVVPGADVFKLLAPDPDDLQAGYVILNAATIMVYGGLETYFTQKLNYTSANASSLPSNPSKNVLVLTGYDWRKSNADSATAVNQTLQNVAEKYPGATIWLVAHSMGGLVCRYLLESRKFSNPTIAGLITIATPHLGVPLALSAITGEADTNKIIPANIIEQLVDCPTLTSTFELLPPPQNEFVFDSSNNAYSIWDESSPVYELLTNTQTGFSAPVAGFEAAQDFFSALDYSDQQNGRPNYYLFYGTGLATIESFLYSPNGGSAQADLAQQSSSADSGGDATVPMSSASFPGGWAQQRTGFSDLTHGELPNDDGVLAAVADILNGTSSG